MNRSAPLVSVVVTTRNSATTLAACLQSIRAQHYKPTEIVVVDDESTDSTPQIAQTHADLVISFGPERSAQRNRGARLAHGAYFLFIDSDMTLSPDVVDDCLVAVQRTDAPAAIIPETTVGTSFLAKCRALERSCYTDDDTVEAARFFSREAFELAAGFDENLTGLEDWDLSMRVAAGRHLPRTRSYIAHDENGLRLGVVLAKKRYYSAASVAYWDNHSRSQANLIFRPAYLRNWRALIRHPVLATGFLCLKSLEMGAGALGLIDAHFGNIPSRSVPKTHATFHDE